MGDAAWLTMAAYASQIGATCGTVKRWRHEGMPVHCDGSSVRVNPAVANPWVKAHPKMSVAFHRHSVVYFAQRADGLIKIGYTSDVGRRINELRKRYKIATPVLLATVVGDKRLELLLHKQFDASRAESEWFHQSAELLALIEMLARCKAEAA